MEAVTYAATRTELATIFSDYESEYRENHEVLHESSHIIVLADHAGHELNELTDRTGVDREELRSEMRERADDALGEQEAHDVAVSADLIVFDKLN